ncbi:MAG: hypothetical protein JSW28_10765 [Thermoplasmata archaeon]|nr:MAG: hypothetical protein JSW28_10765 [Thermoplasmata archaeon]
MMVTMGVGKNNQGGLKRMFPPGLANPKKSARALEITEHARDVVYEKNKNWHP